MTDRTYWRLTDMKAAIRDIRALLSDKSFDLDGLERVVDEMIERARRIATEGQ
jgi:hypothetical protein